MKIITIGFLLLITFISCKSYINFDNDSKFISNKSKLFSTSILLKNNNRFEYSNKEKLANQYTTGTWVKIKNKIILNSDSIYKTGMIFSKEEIINNKRIKIKVLDNLNNFIVNAGITINGNSIEGWNTNKFGVVNITQKNINSIIIHYLSNKYSYKVLDENSNSFIFKLRIDDLSYKYFDEEVWTLDNNKLINPNGKLFKFIK